MSDSAPRRQPPRSTVYVDYQTGFEVSDSQYRRIEKLLDQIDGLYAVMHECDGSSLPGEHQEHDWSSKRMRRAAECIEMGLMLAMRAALEAP